MMDFSQALDDLKSGRNVARMGWNGRGMHLTLVRAWGAQATLPSGTRLLPWIGMKTADGGFVPWLASQTDILAEDWVEVGNG